MPESGLTRSDGLSSAFLELKEERQLVREGFEFLDEKRVILAQEMLKRLRPGVRRASATTRCMRKRRGAGARPGAARPGRPGHLPGAAHGQCEPSRCASTASWA
jgi:hypothetical protein